MSWRHKYQLRTFGALDDSSAAAMVLAMPEVFPWVSHLASSEVQDFAIELISALSDAAELDVGAHAHEVIAGWRSTARVEADRSSYAVAIKPTSGDFGPVEIIA